MDQGASSAPPPKGNYDIMEAIRSLRDEMRTDMKMLIDKIDAGTRSHHDLEMNMLRQYEELKQDFGKLATRVDGIDNSQDRAWADIMKLQQELPRVDQKVEMHLVETRTASQTKKGTAEWVKWGLGFLFGSGIMVLVLKAGGAF